MDSSSPILDSVGTSELTRRLLAPLADIAANRRTLAEWDTLILGQVDVLPTEKLLQLRTFIWDWHIGAMFLIQCACKEIFSAGDVRELSKLMQLWITDFCDGHHTSFEESDFTAAPALFLRTLGIIAILG
jgi:hypothetical protein